MRFAQIRKEDISNGPGIRVSLFVQGCNRHCDGCFNPETWDYDKGQIFNRRIQELFLDLGKEKKITGFSILGGEPLDQDKRMLELIKKIKERYPDKTIWMWTGHTYEDLTDKQMEIVKLIDVLVDGPFIISQKCPGKRFRGSMNQRIIDIKKTLESGTITIHDLQN